MKKIVITVVATTTGLILTPAFASEWITDNHDGRLIVLSDGHKYLVNPVDRVDSALWLPTDDVVVDDVNDRLINIDQNEAVDVDAVY